MKARNTTTKTMRLETAAAKKPAAKKAKAPTIAKEKAPAKKRAEKIVPGREVDPHTRLGSMTKDQKLAAAKHMGLSKYKTGKDAHSAITRAITQSGSTASRVYSAGVYGPFTGSGKDDPAERKRLIEEAKSKKTSEAHDAIDKALAPASKAPASAKPAAKKAATKAPKAEPAPVAKKPAKKALGKGLETLDKEQKGNAPKLVQIAKPTAKNEGSRIASELKNKGGITTEHQSSKHAKQAAASSAESLVSSGFKHAAGSGITPGVTVLIHPKHGTVTLTQKGKSLHVKHNGNVKA